MPRSTWLLWGASLGAYPSGLQMGNVGLTAIWEKPPRSVTGGIDVEINGAYVLMGLLYGNP
jgi:hypothetical protein